MAWPYKETTIDALGGFNSVDNAADVGLTKDKVQPMTTAQNVYQPNDRHDLMTVPGFDPRRSTTINAAGIFTGGIDMGALAAEEFVTVSIAAGSHNIYRNNANPPGAVAGGTNFTIGVDNLIDAFMFRDGSSEGAVFLSRLRDLPQFVNTSATRSDFTIAGTGLTSLKPAIGDVLGARALYGDVNRDGTVELDRVYYSDLRDGNLITDYTTQFLNVRVADGDKVRAIRRFSEVALIGSLSHCFLAAVTEFSSSPYSVRELPLGRGRGPVSQQGTIATDSHLYWMGKQNVHRMGLNGEMEDIGDPIKPTITGLQQDELDFCVAGYSPIEGLVMWNVAPSGATTRTRTLAFNPRTKQWFFWTRSRNAYWNYFDSTEAMQLSGGGYTGLFYQELTSATGDADDAAGAIDADIIGPRHRFPGLVLIAGIKVRFDQQGTSEAVTVQYRLGDNSSWSSFAASPYTVAGTAGDIDIKYFPLMKATKAIQLRFRNANAGQQFRIQDFTIVWKPISPGLSPTT